MVVGPADLASTASRICWSISSSAAPPPPPTSPSCRPVTYTDRPHTENQRQRPPLAANPTGGVRPPHTESHPPTSSCIASRAARSPSTSPPPSQRRNAPYASKAQKASTCLLPPCSTRPRTSSAGTSHAEKGHQAPTDLSLSLPPSSNACAILPRCCRPATNAPSMDQGHRYLDMERRAVPTLRAVPRRRWPLLQVGSIRTHSCNPNVPDETRSQDGRRSNLTTTSHSHCLRHERPEPNLDHHFRCSTPP